MSERKQRTIKLNYWDDTGPHITLLEDPNEVRIASSDKSFMSLKDGHLTLSGGAPSKINIQGMSSSFKFAGMISDMPFPLTMIPSTMATPIPRQKVELPFMNIMPEIMKLSKFAMMLVGR